MNGEAKVTTSLIDPDSKEIAIAVPQQDGCRRKLCPRFKLIASVIAHIAFLSSISFICSIRILYETLNSTSLLLTLVIIAIVSYLIILLEAITSTVYKALVKYAVHISAEEYFERVRNARAQVTWQAECYHYDYESISSGGEMRRLKSRIVTGRDKEAFHFAGWKDYTRDISALLQKPIIRFECSKVFIFKDESSKKHYNQQYQAFRERVRMRDEFMEHDEDFTIPGFQEHVLATVENRGSPWWLSLCVFWMATMFLLTWPYRYMFRRNTCRVYVVFIKQLET